MSFADFLYEIDLLRTVRAPQRMLGNGGGRDFCSEPTFCFLGARLPVIVTPLPVF